MRICSGSGEVGDDAPEARVERGSSNESSKTCGGCSAFSFAAHSNSHLQRNHLTDWSGISLQVQFFNELQHCPPLARFIFEATEAAHTFSSYHYSRAMTAADLEAAFNKCLASHRRAAESGTLHPDAGPDALLAQ